MVDAKIFMAAERNGHKGQILAALRNRFPEIPEQVISQTLQAEVQSRFLFPVSSVLWRICRCILVLNDSNSPTLGYGSQVSVFQQLDLFLSVV